jgi:hypothetical protein
MFQKPLGTASAADREAEIKKVQDDALARAKAAKEQEIDVEREAIQAEGSLDPGSFFGAETKLPPPPPVVNIVNQGPTSAPTDAELASGQEGSEVHVTKGEEMYGKTGTFSSYRVGPFSLTAKVGPGQTRLGVFRQLRQELEVMADEAREEAKKKFLAHFPTATS